MAIKDILLHLDDSKAAKARIDAALALADAQGAHVTGLVAVAAPSMPGYLRNNLPREALEAQENFLNEISANAAERFEKAAKASGVEYELRSLRAPDAALADAISVQARHCDLVVMGQEDETDAASLSREIAEEVLLASGRPLLLIPYVGLQRPIGKTVAVAWDGGREATRAVNDALPLIKDADSVVIMVVNKGKRDESRDPGSDIARHLARHGVKVDVQQLQARDISIADAILDRMADIGADLLVMGGYGHSRTRELVLGGVTLKILQQMTAPVFMSH